MISDLGPAYSGHNKAMSLIEPFLNAKGVTLSFFSMKNLGELYASANNWRSSGYPRPQFIVFNAMASLQRKLSPIALRSCISSGAPTIVYWREIGQHILRTADSNRYARQSLEVLAKHGLTVQHIANSVYCADSVRAALGFRVVQPVGNCAFVPEPFDSPEEPSLDPPVIIAVGNVLRKKGVDLFVRIAREVCRSHPSVEFIWLGAGTLDAELMEELKMSGFERRITFAGYCNTPFILTRRAVAVLICSREESFSQVAAEAMCQGKVVVTFPNGGPPEVLGRSGIVLRDWSQSSAVEVLLRLLASPRGALVDNHGPQRYRLHFTPAVHAERLVNFLGLVLGAGRTSDRGTLQCKSSVPGDINPIWVEKRAS